ncbi:MAG: hypothetical protein U1F65_00905 [Verrucomicrobiota bacterium]
MNRRLKTILLGLLIGALLAGISQVQTSMNRDRDRLGLTHAQALDNAPPVLAFTTVALGGFRGLISNLLWIRANDLQENEKYFEMMQLADWITKLEPRFPQVWVFQAWNMAYNISVKFKDFSDRWRWLQGGIELLRDEGLKYNPNSPLIHQQLSWFFQHKLGANLDDANMYYKQQWANQMAQVFGKMKEVNFDELINPQTDDQKQRATLLRTKFKMDARLMKEVDQRYGPLEWRLPEAHAIYWAVVGLEAAKANPGKVNPDDLMQLRRSIYQDMLLSFQRGRLEVNNIDKAFDFGPNLDIVPNVNRAYEEQMAEAPGDKSKMATGHRNFLRQAIYSLYVYNRMADAARWYKYLSEQYPDKTIIDGDPTSYPRNVTLDQYVLSCVQVDISETSRDRVKASLEGILYRSYTELALDHTDRYEGYALLAQKIWSAYDTQIPQDRKAAIGLPALSTIRREILAKMLDPEAGIPAEARAIIRTRLNLKTETPSTNAVPDSVSSGTNAVPAVNPQ